MKVKNRLIGPLKTQEKRRGGWFKKAKDKMAFGHNIERKSQKLHGHPISSKVLPCIAHLPPKDPKR
jgi:hypothetical protein